MVVDLTLPSTMRQPATTGIMNLPLALLVLRCDLVTFTRRRLVGLAGALNSLAGHAAKRGAGLLLTLLATHGAILNTQLGTDLTIVGSGYFILRDPESQDLWITRDGALRVDADGYLVSNRGLRLQGCTNPAGTERRDIRIEPGSYNWSADSPAQVLSFAIRDDGAVQLLLLDGTILTCANILLQPVAPANAIPFPSGHAYANCARLPSLEQAVRPGSEGVGMIRSGALEVADELRLEIVRAGSFSDPIKPSPVACTGQVTDLAISVPGFFMVRDPATDRFFATRAGAFKVDREDRLVTLFGFRVQGYLGQGLDQFGDVRVAKDSQPPGLPGSGMPAAHQINSQGELWLSLSDGTAHCVAQLCLLHFARPERLAVEPYSLFSNLEKAEPTSPMSTPSRPNPGDISCGYLEVDKLDPALLELRNNTKYFNQGALICTESQENTLPEQPDSGHGLVCCCGRPTDLAIEGLGFFVLRDPADGRVYVTRCGAFELGLDGTLEMGGLRLQGSVGAEGVTIGDLRMDPSVTGATSPPGVDVQRLAIDGDGTISFSMPDGSWTVHGQILLQRFHDPDRLTVARTNLLGCRATDLRELAGPWAADLVHGDWLYTNLEEAGPLEVPQQPGTGACGRIMSGRLELLEQPYSLLQSRPNDGHNITIEPTFAPRVRWGEELEVSSDLVHWFPLPHGNRIRPDDTYIDDESPQTLPQRFYRLRVGSTHEFQPQAVPLTTRLPSPPRVRF